MARTDEAEATIRILGEDLVTGVAAKAEKSIARVGDATDTATKASVRLKEGWATIATGINSGLDLVGKVGQGIREAMEMAKEAAVAQARHAEFSRRFVDSEASLQKLRTAASERVSDSALEQLASQAQRLGFTLEQTVSLVGVGVKAASANARQGQEVIAELLKGAAEGSDEMLRQLGVLTSLPGAAEKYATSLGLTVQQLTRQQVATASLDESVAALGKQYEHVTGDDALAKIDQASTKWANFKARIGEAGLAVFEEVHDGLTGAATERQLRRVQEMGDQAQRAIGAARHQLMTEMGLMTESPSEAARGRRDSAAASLAAVITAEKSRTEAIAASRKAMEDALLTEDKATRSALATAQAQAEAADRLGLTAIAADRYEQAISAADRTSEGLSGHVSLLTSATAMLGNAFAQSQLQLAQFADELAQAAPDIETATAAIMEAEWLRSEAAGSLTGKPPGPPKPPKSGGSKGKSTLDSELEANAKATAAGQQRMADAQWEIRELAELALAEQHERAKAEDEARFQERLALLVQQHEEQQRILAESRSGGFDSLSDSILGLRDALGELDGISLDGLASAANKMGPLIDQFGALSNATDKSKGAMVSGTLGIVASSGKMVAGIIKDQRAQAVIMALVEQAEAWASFARYDYVGFGAHLASSAIWATVAGTSGGGGGKGGGAGAGGSAGGGRAAGAVPRVPNESPPDGPSFAPITLHISGGTYLGTDAEKTGRELAKMVDRHRGRSFRGGDAGSPP